MTVRTHTHTHTHTHTVPAVCHACVYWQFGTLLGGGGGTEKPELSHWTVHLHTARLNSTVTQICSCAKRDDNWRHITDAAELRAAFIHVCWSYEPLCGPGPAGRDTWFIYWWVFLCVFVCVCYCRRAKNPIFSILRKFLLPFKNRIGFSGWVKDWWWIKSSLTKIWQNWEATDGEDIHIISALIPSTKIKTEKRQMVKDPKHRFIPTLQAAKNKAVPWLIDVSVRYCSSRPVLQLYVWVCRYKFVDSSMTHTC